MKKEKLSLDNDIFDDNEYHFVSIIVDEDVETIYVDGKLID